MKALTKYLILFIISLCCYVDAFAQSFNATVDRDQVNVGDSFKLSLNLEGQNPDSTPDFSPLKKSFEVVATEQSQQVTIINGATTSNSSWTLTLFAKEKGDLIIPSIQLGNLHTQPISIEVKNAIPIRKVTTTPKSDVYLEASTNTVSPFINEGVVYTVKLFYATNIMQGQLSDPKVDNAFLKVLGKNSQYDTEVNGKFYKVLQRHFVITPQKSGNMVIEPVVFTGSISEGNNYYSGLFNNYVPAKRSASPIKLSVKAIPSNVVANEWLPAQAISVKENFSKSPVQWKEGEPITQTLTVEAQGVTAESIPSFKFANIEGMNSYPANPIRENYFQGNILKSRVTQKIVLIPTRSGSFTIPSQVLKWWNITKNQQAQTMTTTHTVNVMPTNLKSSVDIRNKPLKSFASNNSTQIFKKSFQPVIEGLKNNRVMWGIVLFLAMGWLTPLIWWLFYKGTSGKNSGAIQSSPRVGVRPLLRGIKKSCLANDKLQTKQDILKLMHLRFGKSFFNLQQVSEFVEDKTLKQELNLLDKNIYGKGTSEWDGKKFWRVFEKHWERKEVESAKKDGGLRDLYLS